MKTATTLLKQECDKRIQQTGTSLCIIITAEANMMGLSRGDIVHVTLERRQ